MLKDATSNYPAWLDAIASARRHIFLESYIIHNDSEGVRFAEALIRKAREGVQVYLIYDWVGAFPDIFGALWRKLRKGGVFVRCFNPPSIIGPLAWLTRDHRKTLVVDNRIAFVSGLCIGCKWAGDSAKGIEPWRDTGMELIGPAVKEIAHAFSRAWAHNGDPLPAEHLRDDPEAAAHAGDVDLRVIATEPESAGVFRMDQLVAAIARSRLWLASAYFTGATVYVQALAAAARDGVDVRLLLPGSSDISIVSPISRVGYRPLLENGVRVFEWNGPMMHAKTAVADGLWARIGSTNLNFASWTGNWELDVAVEDARFGEEMEQMFLEDLSNSTEIILEDQRFVRRIQEGEARRPGYRRRPGRTRRMFAGALTLGKAFDAAVVQRRDFNPTEARALLSAALALLGFALLLSFFPKVITIPASILLAWISMGLIVRVLKLWRNARINSKDKSVTTAPAKDVSQAQFQADQDKPL